MEDAPDLLRPQETAVLLRVGKNSIGYITKRKGFLKLYVPEKHFVIPKTPAQTVGENSRKERMLKPYRNCSDIVMSGLH